MWKIIKPQKILNSSAKEDMVLKELKDTSIYLHIKHNLRRVMCKFKLFLLVLNLGIYMKIYSNL